MDAYWLRTTMTSKPQGFKFERLGACGRASARCYARIYKAVVQSVLLYGSEAWNLTRAVLA